MDRIYLTVPYGIKDQVKARYRIHWDAQARRWYATDPEHAAGAQALANSLLRAELQAVPRVDTVLYEGRHHALQQVPGALTQTERIALTARLVKPKLLEPAYEVLVRPEEEPSFRLRFGARSDADAVLFCKALALGRILRNLVQGGINELHLTATPRIGDNREVFIH